MSIVRHPIANFLLFQLCWFCSILGSAAGLPELGPLAVAAWLAAHLGARPDAWRTEGLLILAAAVVGYLGDSALVLAGTLSFPAQAVLGGPSTVWMVTMWMAFAATLGSSLSWMSQRYVLGFVFGCIGGPLAYWAGARLGAVELGSLGPSLGAIAVLWGIAILALLKLKTLVDPGTVRTGSTPGDLRAPV